MDKKLTKVITNPIRLSYAYIWEGRQNDDGKIRYSTSIIIPKTDTETVNKIRMAIQAAYDEGKEKLKGGGKQPPSLQDTRMWIPLRDGDIERSEDEVYKNSYFLSAKSDTPPQVVDLARKPIEDQSEVYSGCYCRVSLNFYAFNKKGHIGIACGLGNVQKVRDGERLSGKTNAKEDFDDDYAIESDDIF